MLRGIFAAVSAALLLVTMACSSYNQEPSASPAASPTSAGTAPATNLAAAGQTPLPSGECPPPSPVPASIPNVPAAPSGAETVTTPSGLKYIDLAPGTGAAAQSGQTATVNYTGWLVTGSKFDSSKDHGTPFSFPLGGGQVIKGWDEGVVNMKVGGQRRLFVPPALGYGPRGGGGVIPPCATLVFDVELLGVK